ncbi:MAG: hypothetical protein MZV70_64055 [Desulfobacterales bacterium]|nr:hypothetical protein [Desulfobacterales bacterium]
MDDLAAETADDGNGTAPGSPVDSAAEDHGKESGRAPEVYDPQDNKKILVAIIQGLQEMKEQPQLFGAGIKERNDAPVSPDILGLLFSVSSRQVYNYAKEGIITKEQRGRYPVLDLDAPADLIPAHGGSPWRNARIPGRPPQRRPETRCNELGDNRDRKSEGQPDQRR